MRGKFITLEGPEGCGKSTQAGMLADALRAAGKFVTDREEDMIEATIERVYYKELRNARRDANAAKAATSAIKDAVKATFNRFNAK